MEDVHRSLLKRVSFRIDLEPMKCMPYLIQDNILDENDEQQIKVQPTRTDQVDKMLDILPRRGPHAFRCLVDALKKVQPHLADLLLEGEEMEKKLSMERCNSARLGDRLREARDKLEQLELEKNKLENIRKELEECLHQVENEKEKMISNINELNKMKERLTKDLDEEKKEKLSLQSRYVDLKEVLQSQSKVIERLEASFQRNDASSSSKVSADELGSQEKPHLSGRPTSARSQHNPKERVNVEYVRYLMAYRDYAKTCVKRYEKQLKIFEEKQMSKIDKATTMDDTGLNTCSKCTVHESEYNELQQAKEKIECSLKEMTDKYERENKHLESSLQCNEMLRNEMSALTAKHKSDMEDKEIALKYKLVEKSKVTIRHLRRVLTRERQKYKKINKRFNKYKKKTKSKNKKLEDDIKSKALRLEVLEAELKEAKDHEHNKGLEDMNKSKATLNGQQDTHEEHENKELARQEKLEDDIKSKALRLEVLEAELKEAKDHEHNKGLEDMNKSKATLNGQQDTQEEHKNAEELTRQEKLEDGIKSKALRSKDTEAELKEAKVHEHNQGLEDMNKSKATLNGQQDTQEEHENEELTRQKKLEDDIKSKVLRLEVLEAELKEAKVHEHNKGLEDMNKSKATLNGQQDTQEEHKNAEELTRQEKLEDGIKSKALRSEVLEAELKEAKDHEHNKGLEDMNKSKATLNGQQDTHEEHENKELARQEKLEDDIKSKALRLKDTEAELKEAKNHEHNQGLKDMNKSKATLKGQQDTQEEHENEELTRQKKLEDDIKSKVLRSEVLEAELKEAKDHEHNKGLEDMNKSKATLNGQQDTQEEHENEELTRQKKLEDDIKSKVLRSEVLEAELKEAKDHEHNKGLEDMNKSKATLNRQQDTQEEHKNEELTRQKNLPGKRALSAFHGSDLALQRMRLSLLPNKN